eukprot:g22671.t1
MPKKPLGHLQLYTRDKVKELKKVKPDLKALSDEEKKVYEDKGNQLLTEYEANLSEFKATENFKKYASTIKRLSHKPKASSGAPKKPGTMPAKPPDALKLYKDELGAGKKTSELVAAFQELPAEEKAKYRGRAEEAKKEFEERMKEWKSTEEGKKYIKETRAFEKRRKLTNARHKFLKDEPKRPPNATLLFCNEKRSEYAAQFPGLKGLQLNGKMAEIYRGMSAEDKKEFEDKAKERQEDDYKKYLNAIKAKPAGKAKAKAATKDKKKGPAPPASMPKKPGTAMTLFMKQNKGGGTLAKQSQAFKELPEEEMEAFKKTAEGKRYFRLKAASEKKSRIETAKKKYLEDAKPPKSAPSAYQLFVQEKRPALQSAGKSMQEVAKELTTTWRSLTVEEQKPFEERADKAKAFYEEQLEAYRSSPGYKKFEKFKSSINRKPTKKTKKPKAKAKGRAKAKAKGRGRQKEPEKKADNSSTSDVMGSDTKRDRLPRLYKDALSKKSKEYWDYERMIESWFQMWLFVKWGVLDDYEVTQKIGRGKYSEVFTGFHVPTNKKCVIKILKPVKKKKIKREIKILQNATGGPNIVELLDVRGLMLRTLYPKLTPYDIKFYLYQVLKALDYSHSQGLMHRDVKPHNDWGLAEFYHPLNEYNVRHASRHYKGPELLVDDMLYDYSLDIWSFGCMLAGLTFRKEPFFAGADNVDQLYKIARVLGTDLLEEYLDAYDLELELEVEQRLGKLPRKPWSSFKNKENSDRCSPEALDLIDKMLRYDPAARILPKEAMAHAFFADVRKEKEK